MTDHFNNSTQQLSTPSQFFSKKPTEIPSNICFHEAKYHAVNIHQYNYCAIAQKKPKFYALICSQPISLSERC